MNWILISALLLSSGKGMELKYKGPIIPTSDIPSYQLKKETYVIGKDGKFALDSTVFGTTTTSQVTTEVWK